MKISINVGSWDRWLRVALGLGLLSLMFAGYIGLWGWLGLIAIATGVFKFCPAYSLLGISTCQV
jgi:Protein of unknown function (DUF2892)